MSGRKYTMKDLAAEFGLPQHILRRLVDLYGVTEPRRYPRQFRVVLAERLPELRRRLRADGYLRPLAPVS